MRFHGVHRRGVLLATVLVGALASIATSPPYWIKVERVDGPAITLAPELPARQYAITLRVTASQLDNASGSLYVSGTLGSPQSALVVLAALAEADVNGDLAFEEIMALLPETPREFRFDLGDLFRGCSMAVCEGRAHLAIRAEELIDPVTMAWSLEATILADLPEPESVWIDVIIEEL
jgi:hypothetical protein